MVTCLLVISLLMSEVEFSPTDLKGPVCIVTLLQESKDSGDTRGGLIRGLSLLDDLNPARALVM